MIRATTLLLIFTGISSLSMAQSSIKGHEYILTGEIINTVGLPAHCGVLATATVIEFKISSFTDSNYKGKEMGIVFTCPEFYGADFFKVGGKYEVQLADENQATFGWTIFNLELLDKYTLSYIPYAISAKRLDGITK
jgi:hypothetical protein